ncbi:MAG: glycosyltransferase family 1 protein [Candidatus Omnitrophica bacterium CG07_land_8_20_14_0_80_42_15]|uniref:Glycosyltransferase family 1 protein n=1 Tax=Candidatus Aquitaenariimonas noxiae TaxID=1974741 RepID=A0A2J0L570_9BACT|nr:MAG: glycosyltransferase family 1 protein [Candidatus Omnitrophica bacterium CG07_land_8_20_14_0_80_42_15]
MRIALFAWESMHSISVGGVAVHVTELACALERKGHEVHVFTRVGDHNQPWYECIHGVHYHRCPFQSSHDFVEEVNNMCRSFVHTFFDVENMVGRFDIIHAHDWLASNAMVWIKEGRGHKSVMTIHSTEYGRCGNNFFGGTSARVRDHERHGTYCADRIISVSKALKGEIMWMYNVPDWKAHVVYNGINYRNYDGWIDPAAVRRLYGIGPLDPMVLFVGRLVYQKGPDLLLDAVPYILKYYSNAKFVFAGDGEMRWGVEEQARSMGISHATRFLGYTNGWKLVDLYKASDVVCVPSRNEPFGIIILEAWSAGKPVVASLNGGPAEIVWHDVNGLKIYPQPESIAWGIGTAFEDFEHARWMGKNGRIAVESAFSWDAIADQVLAVYHS